MFPNARNWTHFDRLVDLFGKVRRFGPVEESRNRDPDSVKKVVVATKVSGEDRVAKMMAEE
jgi:hypothetical protein